MAYRVWRSPSKLYDAMIFVSQAHPTKIVSELKVVSDDIFEKSSFILLDRL